MLVLIDGRASYRHLVISVLRQPRWVVLAVITLLMCVLFGFLGRWQWHRHEDRRERNQQIEAAAAAAPVPLHEVWSAADPLAEANQYRTVTLTGVYDVSAQLLLRNPNGRSGYAVVTPLVTEAGEALLVNRGWTPASSTDVSSPAADVAPPPGTIQATVRLRAPESDDHRVAPDGQTYAISVDQISDGVPYHLFDGYGELVDQEPAVSDALELPEPVSLGMGPHLFYAIQWWMFIGIALGGYVLLVRRESQPDADSPLPLTTTANGGGKAAS